MTPTATDHLISIELSRFREVVVNEGSAKLLDKYDRLVKDCGSIKQSKPTDWVYGVIGTALFVLPWVYGWYKLFT